jgi:outer membrane lipoprotein carrier protein
MMLQRFKFGSLPAGVLAVAATLALALAYPQSSPADSRGAAGNDTAMAAAASRLQALLDGTETLRGRFEQEVHDGSGRLVERATGRMEIARPGRLRWAYESPYEQLLVTDGERVWMYDADLEQVSITRIEQTIAGSPAMLLGGGRLAEGFEVRETWQRAGLEWVALAPLQSDTDFSRIVLGHDGEVVHRMELVDALGQTTGIVFTDIERGIELAAERFSLVAPPGVDVMGPDGR